MLEEFISSWSFCSYGEKVLQPIYDESSLFELEKKLIRKCKTYKKVEPKSIRIVAENDFDACAEDDAILVSTSFLNSNPDLKQVSDLLKHELLHYVCKEEGHSVSFAKKAVKMKIIDDYTNRQLFDEPHKDWLEGRLSYEVNEKGEQVLIDKKRPSFDRF